MQIHLIFHKVQLKLQKKSNSIGIRCYQRLNAKNSLLGENNRFLKNSKESLFYKVDLNEEDIPPCCRNDF